MSVIQKSALDLVSCEQEPIDRPQAIQAVCALLLFDRDTGKLAMGSDNLEPIFGAPLADLIGSKADAMFEAADAAALDEMMSGDEKPISRYLQLRGQREHFVRVFETEGHLGVELNAWEDAQDQPINLGLDVGNSLQLVEERAAQMTLPSDEEMRDFAQFVADEFRRFSGYDRSMIYRFDSDWNGEIIAESRSENAPGSFLGLNFPSSDIPAQARRLFELNRVRPVVDIEEGSVPILPVRNPKTGQPIDLSDCSVRAVSPVHVEYLQNMGVRATLNIALMARGKLWGLLSNHHYAAPYRLTPARAATCRLLAEIFSTELTRILEATENAGAKFVRDCLRSLRKSMLEDAPDQNLATILAGREGKLLQSLSADGAALIIKDVIYSFGDVPEASVLKEVDRRCKEQMSHQDTDAFSTHFAVGLWPDLAEQIAQIAAGVFACKFPSEDSGLLLFRKPRETQVTWGGDPYKRVQPGHGERLHPRKSFEKFSENVKDRSLPWQFETAAKARECVIGLTELD
jgi:light-regulated signal transduction histidine kinase (bacteriophytochrome)